VQQAFIGEARALERKSPQMRHALEPLIGDGLFISDGLVWKQRRPIVAEVTHTSRLAALAPVMTEVAAEARAIWDAQPADRPLDVLGFMGWLAAEVICRTLFGRTLGSEAARTVVEAVYRARPSSVKGLYVRSVTLSMTMSPPVSVELKEFVSA
jgi:cytochrome P450